MPAPSGTEPQTTSTQVVVRPVALSDLPALLDLAALAGAGLTTLPKDEAVLKRRINLSLQTFSNFPASPGGEFYLFVMESLPDRKVIGASGIISKVGGFEPFYSYIIENAVFESKWINIRKEVPLLRLHEEHDGPAEIGSLFLHPDHRHSGNGRFLQLVRFLFIAQHRDAFETTIVSEIRGVSDSSGNSPFWNALGHHFFGIDFQTADHLSVTNKKFIADLMPDHPIYIPLLPPEAQAVIGKPHPHSAPAIKNLEAEGFTYQNAVDIFDAGPVYACPRDQIRSIQNSRTGVLAEVVSHLDSIDFMIGTTNSNFRATKGPLQELPKEKNNRLRLTAASAESLQLRIGDRLRYVELKSPAPPEPTSPLR